LGGFLDGKLMAVLTLGWGTQPKQTITKLFPTLDTQDYYEIGKMCLPDELPRNSETQFLSAVVKWIKKNHPEKKFLYTLADGIMGKAGYVYQAASFLYGGEFQTFVYRTTSGEKVHPRTTGTLCKENATFLGKEKVFWLTYDFMESKGIQKYRGLMFRFILPLNRKAKRMMKHESTVKWNVDYPKEDSLKFWVQTGRGKWIDADMPEFNYDNIEHNKKNIETHNTQSSTLETFL
jgi:hypothetical protein